MISKMINSFDRNCIFKNLKNQDIVFVNSHLIQQYVLDTFLKAIKRLKFSKDTVQFLIDSLGKYIIDNNDLPDHFATEKA